jgi:hypothetical protein
MLVLLNSVKFSLKLKLYNFIDFIDFTISSVKFC